MRFDRVPIRLNEKDFEKYLRNVEEVERLIGIVQERYEANERKRTSLYKSLQRQKALKYIKKKTENKGKM